MKLFVFGLRMVLIVLLISGIAAAAEPNLPAVKGKKVVATINGEAITLEEYNRELTSLPSADTGKKDELLKRLINARLIVQEGRRAGLNELPEIKQRVEVFSRVTLREELVERQLRNLKPDPKEVERLYKESVKELKMNSALFEKEDVARKFKQTVREGKNFGEMLHMAIAEGSAKESGIGKYLKNRELLPEIREAVAKMKVGEVSPVIRLKKEFVVLRLEDLRYPENKEAKEQANQEALRRKQRDTVTKYDGDLKQKYSKINQKLLAQVDFESKEPGFQTLLKDQRVVAEIKGEKPVTVGELTEQLRQGLYHGVERAIEGKKLNKKKFLVLDEMIHKRVFMKEALRLGIDKTDSYKSKVRDQENSLVFGAYVQKAVVPEVKLQEKELESYYNDHLKEYTYPEMMKIESLVFKKREDAEEAIEKLRKGADLKWLREHIEGQADKNAEGSMNFEGMLLTVKDLPDDLRKAVSGAKSGDFRLYESTKGHFYALVIHEVVPSKPQPYQEARGEIAKKVYNEKLQKAIEDLADKLRALSDVKIYLKEKN